MYYIFTLASKTIGFSAAASLAFGRGIMHFTDGLTSTGNGISLDWD